MNNIDTIYISGYRIIFPIITYPEILDFTTQQSIAFFIIINYDKTAHEERIRLNKDSGDLKCESVGVTYKNSNLRCKLRCIVTKSHFKGKKTGYYSLAYADDSKAITFYEIPPFEVILNDKEPDTYIITFEETPIPIKIGKQGIISLNSNFMDETNIFDKFDIEKQTNFKTNI